MPHLQYGNSLRRQDSTSATPFAATLLTSRNGIALNKHRLPLPCHDATHSTLPNVAIQFDFDHRCVWRKIDKIQQFPKWKLYESNDHAIFSLN
jgi:hypothetical protein